MTSRLPKKKVTFLGTDLDPVLEEIRNSVLKDQPDNEKLASELHKRTKRVHATYLFHDAGISVLASLCRIMSSAPAYYEVHSWKNLGANLGISSLNINYIANTYTCMDPTETIIATYAQEEEATLGNIIFALNKISRFDAISYIKNGFEDLERIAREEQVERTNNEGKGTHDGILRPYNYQNIANILPIALRKCVYSKETYKEEPVIKYKKETHKKVTKISKSVMLTFASDGIEIAQRVAAQFRQKRGTNLPIGVLILDDHFQKVMKNPEEFITHWFQQVSYVVPIVTEGYLNSLKIDHQEETSSFSFIDVQYTKFIHDLMMKYYNFNNCRNDKFRCIIPDNKFQNIINHKHMFIDPVLKVYFKVSEVEQLACRMLNIYDK